MRAIEIPGAGTLSLKHLVLDMNGTLTDRGELIPGVTERLERLKATLHIHIATADTFGTARELGATLGLTVQMIESADEKVALVKELGPNVTVAIGNGWNDEGMIRTARLGIVVIGPEGAASGTVLAADIVCRSVTDALDILLNERSLVATLRR